MLKDGLRQAIRMSICNGVALEFDSINELMMLWYENSRGNIQYKDITYMGKELKIIY
jgi:hypothetical protein